MSRKQFVLSVALGLGLGLVAVPAQAAQNKPLSDRDPDAIDVAKTPVTDLNIDKEEIPEILIAAQARPYDTAGMGQCRTLSAEVARLDEVLGPDMDLPEEERSRISAGRVAKTVVGSFIPFRGLIREVSGANDHERKVRAAIQAGLARRGFLKGMGASKGCAYPASPATRQVIARYMAERAAEEDDGKKKDSKDQAESGSPDS